MKTQRLGQSDLVSSRIIYGVMRIGRAWQAAGAIDLAREDWHRLTNAARWYAGYVPRTGSKHTRA